MEGPVSRNCLEPNSCSFNKPAGACLIRDGLGVMEFFDPARSVADGAIRGRDRRNMCYLPMITSLAAHYGFDVDARCTPGS